MTTNVSLLGCLHPWKLTWQRKYIFKWWIFHCHTSFRRWTVYPPRNEHIGSSEKEKKWKNIFKIAIWGAMLIPRSVCKLLLQIGHVKERPPTTPPMSLQHRCRRRTSLPMLRHSSTCPAPPEQSLKAKDEGHLFGNCREVSQEKCWDVNDLPKNCQTGSVSMISNRSVKIQGSWKMTPTQASCTIFQGNPSEFTHTFAACLIPPKLAI